MSQGGHSVVQDRGPEASSCGYCKSNGPTSVSYRLQAESLTVHDYQGLLDQGWRRFGMLLYKPQMEKTCCPPYTIRLRVDSFIPSEKQNRVLRRMKRWVPFHISHPLLDKQSYVCLSDYLGDLKITKDSLSLSESVEVEAQDIELNEVGGPRSFNVSQSIEVANSRKESEDVSNVMLKLGGQLIRFKHLEARSAIPRNHMDRLVYCLRKYSQVVGPALAARMAYAVQ